MKISELEATLAQLREKHGDIDVLVVCDAGTYSFHVAHNVVEGDEYPEDWEMPDGFEYVELMVFD